MIRPNKHIWLQKSGHAKTSFGLKVVMAVPPPTILFVEAVLFLNHFGCAVWSVPLLFSNPRRQFFQVMAHTFFIKIKKFSTQVLMCCFKTQFRTLE